MTKIAACISCFIIHYQKIPLYLHPLYLLAVGSLSKVLQFSISYNTYYDTHGLFWSRSIPSCSCFQGMDFIYFLMIYISLLTMFVYAKETRYFVVYIS